jgi:hypothetical protein
MRYTVTCPPDVQDKRALLWLQTSDRSAFARASNRIDALLRRWPMRGDDHGMHWTLTVDPLTVVYTLSLDDCQVAIIDYQLS